MVGIKAIFSVAILTLVVITMMPTVWDAIWADDMECLATNTTKVTGGKDCRGNTITVTDSAPCVSCVNGTSWTLLKLIPLVFVGAIVFGGVLLALGRR